MIFIYLFVGGVVALIFGFWLKEQITFARCKDGKIGHKWKYIGYNWAPTIGGMEYQCTKCGTIKTK